MARLQKTLTDYVVIAISPALIMALVGSLVFFLLDVFYQGGFGGRVHYIFALFVFAAVLIARIAIEEGRERAMLFAIPLGLATLFVLSRFTTTSTLLNAAFIGLVWWCADKLTWDCTVIDEREDASGEGLLQTVGLEGASDPHPLPRGEGTGSGGPPQDLQATSSRDAPPAPARNWWTRFIEKRKQPHAPGVWVIYFSLAALPLFGIGQRFIPSGDAEARRAVFRLFLVYVASGLGLLMTTSFLGLRRYLRQRRLEMPLEMAGVWLSVGTVMIVALLVACALLPRPGAEYAITQVSFQVGSPEDLQASRWGAGSEGAEDKAKHATNATLNEQQSPDSSSTRTRPGQEGGGQSQEQGDAKGSGSTEGKQGGGQGAKQEQKSRAGKSGQPKQKPQQAQQGDSRAADQNQSNASEGESKPSSNSEQSENGSSSGEQAKSPRHGDAKPPSQSEETPSSGEQTEAKSESGDASQADSGDSTRTSDQSPSSSGDAGGASRPAFDPSQLLSGLFGSLSHVFKFLYYLFFVLLVGYLLWRYWPQVLEAVTNFVQAIRELLAGLFGGRPSAPAAGEELPVQPVRPPSFADFADPFVTGAAERYSPQELLAYSFQALEAWGRDHGCPRELEQTPHEFADRLELHQANVARQARSLADLYCFEAYSGRTLPRDQLERLRELWQVLRAVPDMAPPGT